MEGMIDQVYSNKVWFENGKIMKGPADEFPINCPNCPAHLCKGATVDRWRSEQKWRQIIYFGDGEGDFCPCSRLQRGDKACARVDFKLLKKLREFEVKTKDTHLNIIEGVLFDIYEWKDLN
jgi:hypothetical protein